MRLGEKIMRDRQVLVNQITIMASVKELAEAQLGYGRSKDISTRCDAAIQVTSRLLRGMPIDQEKPDEPINKTV